MSESLRSALTSALTAFAVQPLREASLGFFKTLGYSSQRTVLVPKSSPRAFLDLFAKPSAPGTGAPALFDQAKALFADWLAADLLFQLTDQELSREAALFPDTTVSASQLRSYIFFAVELKDREYEELSCAAFERLRREWRQEQTAGMEWHHADIPFRSLLSWALRQIPDCTQRQEQIEGFFRNYTDNASK